jgi:hypothetical protein
MFGNLSTEWFSDFRISYFQFSVKNYECIISFPKWNSQIAAIFPEHSSKTYSTLPWFIQHHFDLIGLNARKTSHLAIFQNMYASYVLYVDVPFQMKIEILTFVDEFFFMVSKLYRFSLARLILDRNSQLKRNQPFINRPLKSTFTAWKWNMEIYYVFEKTKYSKKINKIKS